MEAVNVSKMKTAGPTMSTNTMMSVNRAMLRLLRILMPRSRPDTADARNRNMTTTMMATCTGMLSVTPNS